MKKTEKISNSIRIQVFNKTQGKCWYCGKNTVFGNQKNKSGNDVFCVEHIDNYGGNDIENLVPSCFLCNKKKRNRTLEEFRLWLSAPEFSDEQVLYLHNHGIEIPSPNLITFYFETINEKTMD